MSNNTEITLETTDYDDLIIKLNGIYIFSCDFDQHGTVGMNLVENLLKELNKHMSFKLIDKR